MAGNEDYIPAKDIDFNEWQQNLLSYIAAHAGALGVTPAQLALLQAAQAEWNSGFSNHQVAWRAAAAATERKNRARAAFKALIRPTVGRIQPLAEVTDDIRKLMRITVKDRKPTPLDPEYIKTLNPPQMILDFSLRGACRLHVGRNPSNERRNGKPQGISGCALYIKLGGLVAREAGWKLVGLTTRSPFIHKIENKEPLRVAYKACWTDKLGRFGRFCDPVEASITP